MSMTIVSNRNPWRIISLFLQGLQDNIHTSLTFFLAYRPLMDNQNEIENLILLALIRELSGKGSTKTQWAKNLSLVDCMHILDNVYIHSQDLLYGN